MCGLAGIFGNSANKININKMLNLQKHRGPDNSSFSLFNNIALGSCRLSIIDLTINGNMPMKDSSENFEIVYNGEIYNFRELKKKYNLITKSNTDTEVILELYKKLGENFVQKLNGIFSFAILNKQKNEIFCARDHFGIKPFYYFHDNQDIIFSSEIKSILKILKNYKHNDGIINHYLMYGIYEHNNETFFSKIKKLPASHCMKIKKHKIEIFRYWSLEKNRNYLENAPIDQMQNEFFHILKDSFKKQIMSDTNLGINVSSGIDSLSMMLILDEINNGQKNISANSYYFGDEDIDEKKQLETISNEINWNINFYKIKPDDIIDNSEKLTWGIESPFPGIITFAKYMLINKSYDINRKVILEAQGGDEIGAGYKYVFPFFIVDLFKKKKFKKIFYNIKNFCLKENMSYKNFLIFFNNCLLLQKKGKVSADGTDQQKFLFKIKPNLELPVFKKNKNMLDQIIYRDIFSTKLPRILHSCDKVSMLNSKELRVPLLDKRLVEFSYNLPNEIKIKNGNLRYFYRYVIMNKFKRLNLPEYFFHKKKNYIADPQGKWLKNQLFDWGYSIVSNQNTFYEKYIDKKDFLKKFASFRKSNESNSFSYWQIINLELWNKVFFKNQLN